jgi:cell division protein FtsL
MKKLFLMSSMGMLFICSQVSAQQVNTDSLKLLSQISQDQLKLGKLQNTVDQKTKDKQDGAVKAQQSADKNVTDANRLSNDPQNKKDARNADNSASDAKSDARKARNASGDLDKLNKNIADLQSKIYDEKIKLSRYTQVMPPAVAPAPVQSDTTQHQ